ncbi:hypothetical protein V2J09_015124 [Rumex salicifolius]
MSVIDPGSRLDGGLDICVDLTRSSPLTQSGMSDFVSECVVIEAAHRKSIRLSASLLVLVYYLSLFLHWWNLSRMLLSCSKGYRNSLKLKTLRHGLLHIFSLGLVLPLLKE